MGLAGEERQEKVFVLCFCVWRVGHRFSEGEKFRAVGFPWWEQSGVLEWVQGCQLCCVTGAGGDQPELEERMRRDELHLNLGIPVHPSWVPAQDPEWGSAVHVIPVKCQWLRCRCAGNVRFLGCCYH